jgi:hypothetical protein
MKNDKMNKINPFLACAVITALTITSCSNNPDSDENSSSSSSSKWYGDCEGISNNYGSSKVSDAARKLLEKKVGPTSSYRFYPGNVEVRGNCQFVVSMKAQSDIGEPMEQLSVRVAWDGKEFYLVN